MIAFLQAAPLWESRADQFKALVQGANKAGDDYKYFNHLKLAMEMRGDYVPKSELEALLRGKAESGDMADVPREELERQARMGEDPAPSESEPTQQYEKDRHKARLNSDEEE
jgi:hypothetical protein